MAVHRRCYLYCQEANCSFTGGITVERYIPWTEDELRSEIARLDNRINEQSRNDDKRSRCAVSYLRQVIKDKQDTLHLLRMRRPH